ncbi:hypothetical protein TI39_contig900g00001 [Zymoseptoria brevis]|uniref:Uncharacterized protein n=1 Tax=Zymoseptoria brevis TaxID=1047168 RepID=A0A0F4GEX5_9PEZI|nr:hypothetical protein TI39_contig900g00001 [Zymoseptoria brevis]
MQRMAKEENEISSLGRRTSLVCKEIVAQARKPLVATYSAMLPRHMQSKRAFCLRQSPSLVNHFNSCATTQRHQVFPNPIFAKIIAQNVELASVREAASDIAAFPYQLAIGHSDFKDMISEISAEDLPSKQLLWPLLKSFNKLTDEATDSAQRSVSLTNALIDNTIIVHSWARDKLQLVEAREKSFLSPLRPIARAIGLGNTFEAALLKVFTLTISQLVQ